MNKKFQMCVQFVHEFPQCARQRSLASIRFVSSPNLAKRDPNEERLFYPLSSEKTRDIKAIFIPLKIATRPSLPYSRKLSMSPEHRMEYDISRVAELLANPSVAGRPFSDS